MSKHTPEPQYRTWARNHRRVVDVGDNLICTAETNMFGKRIAASLDALNGIKTSDLEAGIVGEMVELLRESILTLESCAETFEINEKNDPLKIYASEIKRTRALLSKIKES